jgi:hypothetical protein
MSNNILSEEIKNRQWYIQNPIDEENIDTQSISSEIPNINYPSKINNEIICNKFSFIIIRILF